MFFMRLRRRYERRIELSCNFSALDCRNLMCMEDSKPKKKLGYGKVY